MVVEELDGEHEQVVEIQRVVLAELVLVDAVDGAGGFLQRAILASAVVADGEELVFRAADLARTSWGLSVSVEMFSAERACLTTVSESDSS